MLKRSNELEMQKLESAGGGKGTLLFHHIATKEEMFNHAEMFGIVTIEPGCSAGDHNHDVGNEFSLVLEGSGVYHDNGKETVIYPGDVCFNVPGEMRGTVNNSNKPLKLLNIVIK